MDFQQALPAHSKLYSTFTKETVTKAGLRRWADTQTTATTISNTMTDHTPQRLRITHHFFHTLMRSDAGMNHFYNIWGILAPAGRIFVAILSFFSPSDRQLLALQLQLWQFPARASGSLASVSCLELSGALCIFGIMSLMIPVDLGTIRVQIQNESKRKIIIQL